MTDAQLAWKATKVAAIAFGGLLAFIFLVVGLSVAAVAILGKVGAELLYLAFLFGIIWFCAALDIHGQEKRAASCDTQPKAGDVKQAPLVSGAVVSEASETPKPQSSIPEPPVE